MNAHPPGAAAPTIDDFIAAKPYALSRLRSAGFSHEAEDAVQEALWRAHLWLRAGGSVPYPRMWLAKVAIRVAGRARKPHLQLCVEPVVHPFADFEREEEFRALYDAILRAVALLPADLRESFAYCKVEDHTIAETAQWLGLAEGTVNGRVIRARNAIRKMLEKKSA